jgi:hypothetical protein
VAGAGVGAAVAPPELSCARHWARNCGQVSPFVVPAALAACHCSPHCFMTLWAFALLTSAKASVIVATTVNLTIENRIMLSPLSALEARATLSRLTEEEKRDAD